jgi:hypothetical protein
MTPKEEDKLVIATEYCQMASWEERVNERGAKPPGMLSFKINEFPPHVPEGEAIVFPPQTTLNVPISGLSPGLYNRYT